MSLWSSIQWIAMGASMLPRIFIAGAIVQRMDLNFVVTLLAKKSPFGDTVHNLTINKFGYFSVESYICAHFRWLWNCISIFSKDLNRGLPDFSRPWNTLKWATVMPVWPHALLRQIPWSIVLRISSKIKYKLCYIEALPMSIMLINNMYIMSYTLCWIYFILQDGWGIFNITGWGRSVAPTGMKRAGPNKLL